MHFFANTLFSLKFIISITIALFFTTTISAQILTSTKAPFTDTSIIKEQVYIGYGNQRKKEISGAVSYVDANMIAQRNATGLLDAIQGQVTGVQIAQESGRPGANSSITARGVGTFLNLFMPIYVVDGAINVYPDGINPSDIESVQIMKDAAAAGIYGPESTNGVIIITTKRGNRGRARFNCNVLTSIGKMSMKLPEASVDDYKLYQLKLNGIGITDTLNTYFTDNDYQRLISQTAVRNQVDLSVAGGSKKLTYYGGFSYLADKGVILNSWSNIGRARFNFDYNPTDRLSFGVRLQGASRKENRIEEANIIPLLLTRSPMLPLYKPDGSFTSLIAGSANPMAMVSLEKHNYTINDESIYGFASCKFASYLKLTIDGHLTNNHIENLNFTPSSILYYSFEDVTRKILTKSKYSAIQAYLDFDKTISNKHRIYALLGLNKGKETQSSQNTAYQYGYPYSSTYDSWYKLESDFARVGYSYSEKYLVNASVSREGNIPSNPKWYYFETVSAGWRFSEEQFMDWPKKVLTDGKLRLSYGTTNKSKTEPTSSSPFIIYNSTTFEQRNQLNAGIDLSLFRGKVKLSIDAYSKTTKNALIEVPIPISYNQSATVITNKGTITNTGIELSVEAMPIKNIYFSWDVFLNMSLNKNKVSDFWDRVIGSNGNIQLWELGNGGSVGDLSVYKALGVYQYDASNAYSSDWQLLTATVNNNNVTYSLNGQPYTGTIKKMTSYGIPLKGGDIIWDNMNSVSGQRDSSIDYNDRAKMGNAIPKCTGGLTNIFSYKQFSLSFNFYFSLGNKMYNGEFYNANMLNNSSTTPTVAFINGAWTKQGDITIYPRLKQNSGNGNTTNLSSLYVEDASFVRLRNIRFTYHLPHPKSISKSSELSVYLFANNIATWTKYLGYDPEMSITNGTTAGYDAGRYPRKKEIGMGVNIEF